MVVWFLLQVLLRGLPARNDRLQRDEPIHAPRGKKSVMPPIDITY